MSTRIVKIQVVLPRNCVQAFHTLFTSLAWPFQNGHRYEISARIVFDVWEQMPRKNHTVFCHRFGSRASPTGNRNAAVSNMLPKHLEAIKLFIGVRRFCAKTDLSPRHVVALITLFSLQPQLSVVVFLHGTVAKPTGKKVPPFRWMNGLSLMVSSPSPH